jgi:hypothetical protein
MADIPIFLYAGEPNPNDIRMGDPTIVRPTGAKTLACDVGVYSYTGQVADLKRGYKLVCDVGTYSYTGQDAALKKGYKLVCDVGVYSYTGQDATFKKAYKLTCDVGVYSYTGQDVALKRGYKLTCDVGVYSYNGQDATLTYSPSGPAHYTLACDVGVFSYAGQDAILTYTPVAVTTQPAGDVSTWFVEDYQGRKSPKIAGIVIEEKPKWMFDHYRLECEVGRFKYRGMDITFKRGATPELDEQDMQELIELALMHE